MKCFPEFLEEDAYFGDQLDLEYNQSYLSCMILFSS